MYENLNKQNNDRYQQMLHDATATQL